MSYPVSSFVVRFHIADVHPRTDEATYRIKVTHVQTEQESTFEQLADAVAYLEKAVEVMRSEKRG